MDKNKILTKLEADLYHFMVSEFCKKDPSKRNSSELYKYKGLSLSVAKNANTQDKIIVVGIGALEAQFKVGSCDKISGNLSPDEEKIIQIWMGQPEVNGNINSAHMLGSAVKKQVAITPFDLEDYYLKN